MMLQAANLALADPTSDELIENDSESMDDRTFQSYLGSSNWESDLESRAQRTKVKFEQEEEQGEWLGKGDSMLQDVTPSRVQEQKRVRRGRQVHLDEGEGLVSDQGHRARAW